MIKTFLKDLQLISDIRNFRHLPYVCSVASTEEDRLEARRLQARIYMEKGNINKDQIDSSGVLDDKTDSFADRSTYFIVTNTDTGEIEAASRQINHQDDLGFGSFQIFSKTDVSEEGTHYVERFDPKDVVEISGLVKKQGATPFLPMYLYRHMWRYSLQKSHKLWIMVITDHLYNRIKPMFGDIIHEVGDKVNLPHSNNYVFPAAIEIDKTEELLRREAKQATGASKIVKGKLLDFFLTEP